MTFESEVMGADLNQIQQKLDSLMAQTAQIAQKAEQVFQGYLEALGQSVSQQLVMAVYHLCTQAEPQAFLNLTLTQQQTLQQELQKQGYQLQQALQTVMQELLDSNDDKLEPSQLLQSLQAMDEEIVAALRETSRQANHLLQDHQILEIKSMDTLFEIAAKAEESGRSITSPPHLLKALVESKESEGEANTPMMAIYLQVADLEFAEPELMGWRHQVRQLIQQLLGISKEYRQQLTAKTRSEAEAAWRASWFVYQPEGQPPASPEPGSQL